MASLLASLPDPFQADLNQIRACVDGFSTCYRRLYGDNAFNPIAWADHVLALLEEWLLDDEQQHALRLNPWDVFLLHASAYLCDIGLTDAPNAQCPASDAPTVYPDDAIDGVDVSRHSQHFILHNWKDLGIRSADIANAIADICRAVSLDDPTQDEAISRHTEHVFDGTQINAGLISAAVWLAKALNPKAPATAARIRRLRPSAEPMENDRYRLAFSVTGIGPHPYMPGTILQKITCRDPEVHRLLKHHERAVQRRLHRLNRSASPRFLFSDVIYEIEADGYTPLDLKFTVDTSAALQLLTGNRLYADNRVFLRELIQNAVDACHLRKRLEPAYDPAISIRFNDGISVVTVRDNGIGMDRQWIEKYFLTIGISLYQSTEVHSAHQRSRIDFSFISQFGIGFLSSFLVADKIIIKTRKPRGSGFKITITNLRDYFDVRPLDEDFAPGTEVSLHLKQSRINYCRSLEYAGYLKTNIRFLDIPVRLHDQDGRVVTIGREAMSYHDDRTSDIDFIAPLAFDHSEGYLLLRAKKNVDHIFTVETASGGVSVFQDGIFITQLDILLPEGARQHVVGRINLMGKDKCALSMDRNRIFWSDAQLMNIKRAIRMGLAEATHRFLETTDAQEIADGTRNSIVNQLAIFFDVNEVDDAVHQRLHPSIRGIVEKRFRDFIRIHFAHTNRVEGIPEADGYGQCWQQQIVNSFRRN
jgi:hypothetical protein